MTHLVLVGQAPNTRVRPAIAMDVGTSANTRAMSKVRDLPRPQFCIHRHFKNADTDKVSAPPLICSEIPSIRESLKTSCFNCLLRLTPPPA